LQFYSSIYRIDKGLCAGAVFKFSSGLYRNYTRNSAVDTAICDILCLAFNRNQAVAVYSSVIGLGCNYAAYEAENYRAGLFSVPRGQMEAAISLGMSRNQALRFVILPQALRMVLPPVKNDFISLLKD
jgi:ABC-type amino acid transport system permease subunit